MSYQFSINEQLQQHIATVMQDRLRSTRNHHTKSTPVSTNSLQFQLRDEDTTPQTNTVVSHSKFQGYIALLSFLSLFLSVALLYGYSQQADALLIGISFSSLFLVILKIANLVRKVLRDRDKLGYKTTYFLDVFSIVYFSVHPNIWTPNINHYLHIVLVFRLVFIFKFVSTMAKSEPRQERICLMYGIDSSNSYTFNLKSLVQEFTLGKMALLYALCLVLNSHMFYIADYETNRQTYQRLFLECVYIVGSTFTTVGYGDFELHNKLELLVLILSIMIGIVANALVILTSLKTFFMDTNEQSSHNLFTAIRVRQQLDQALARRVIYGLLYRNDKMKQQRQRKEMQRLMRLYRTVKKGADRVGMIESMASNFRTGLANLKTSQTITNNLLQALIKRLEKEERRRKLDNLVITRT